MARPAGVVTQTIRRPAQLPTKGEPRPSIVVRKMLIRLRVRRGHRCPRSTYGQCRHPWSQQDPLCHNVRAV